MNTLFKYFSRWKVLQMDLLLSVLSLLLAYLLRFNFVLPLGDLPSLYIVIPVVLLVKLIVFALTRSHEGIVRHTHILDAKKVFIAVTLSQLIIGVLSYFYKVYYFLYLIPISILFIDYLLCLFFMSTFRLLTKALYYQAKLSGDESDRVLIYGAGQTGIAAYNALLESGWRCQVMAFVDEDVKKQQVVYYGIKVYSAGEHLGELIRTHQINMLVFALPNLDEKVKDEVLDLCLSMGVKVRQVPVAEKWVNGKFSYQSIRNLDMEDLIGRPAVQMHNEKLQTELHGKTILVTGAAGSIGGELARQIVRYNPAMLVLIDQAETPLHDLELELASMPLHLRYQTVVADIRDTLRMEQIFATYKPHIVFHAAAYKHVPVMEEHPYEAIATNVLGTRVLADLSVHHQVQKFIFISTDKAVNPGNIMGASKRVAEKYVQALNAAGSTSFITTRFGNVWASNGSVAPLFRKQIAEGGPVTVTHPDITRYFMTLQEACTLVLEAAMMGNGGEIYLFDMGKPVKIDELARKMIRLSGLQPEVDIPIIYTGLRPGEKLHEELLLDKEKTLPTHHKKIMIARESTIPSEKIINQIKDWESQLNTQSKEALTIYLKQLVPEYQPGGETGLRLHKDKPNEAEAS